MSAALSVNLNFVLAKIHGMRSRTYERERLERALNVRNMLELMRMVSPGEEYRSHRAFEQKLVGRHVGELAELCMHLRSPFRETAESYLRRYQVENLKVILRGWSRGASASEIEPYLVALPKDMTVSVEELLAAPSVGAFLGRTKSKTLAAGGEMGEEHFAETKSTYFIEAGLDRAWLGSALKSASRLGEPHRGAVMRVLSLEADQYQVLFVMRARLNYDRPAEELKPYLLTGPGTKVGIRDLMSLAEMRGAGEMMTAAKKWRFLTGGTWPEAKAGESAAEMMEGVEEAFTRRLYEVANNVFYTSFDLGAVIAFFALKRMELANLIVLVESLRYDIPRPEAAGRMIGAVAAEVKS
jgi:V/A-type H+/Na+-transporting ATPase subunit C